MRYTDRMVERVCEGHRYNRGVRNGCRGREDLFSLDLPIAACDVCSLPTSITPSDAIKPNSQCMSSVQVYTRSIKVSGDIIDGGTTYIEDVRAEEADGGSVRGYWLYRRTRRKDGASGGAAALVNCARTSLKKSRQR